MCEDSRRYLTMYYIPVILGSTRRGRQSPRVARFVAEQMKQTGKIDTEILDLLEYDFPIMEERLRFRDEPPPRLREFSQKIARSDSLVRSEERRVGKECRSRWS